MSKVIVLRVLGITGAALFGAVLALTFVSITWLEASAKGFVHHQLRKEAQATYTAVNDSTAAQTAKHLLDRLGLEETQIHAYLKDDLPQKMAAAIASLCGYDCERKKLLTESITAGYLHGLQSISLAEQRLVDIVRGKYLVIVKNLQGDVRIFAATNLAMFALLLLASLLKPRALLQLYVPGLLLFVATLVASAVYLFGQDWFYTILYNDYMGVAYLGYLAAIFGLLLDVILNRARVTTELVNAIANAIGSAVNAVPC